MKSQIWSPDQLEACGGFQAYGSPANSGNPVVLDAGFQILPDVLRDLIVEPTVKNYVESIVQEKTQQALVRMLRKFDWVEKSLGSPGELEDLTAEELESELKRIEDGLALERKKQHEEIASLKTGYEQSWEKMMSEWNEKKAELLRNHEQKWCEALTYIVEKLQMKNSEKTLGDVQAWIERNVSELMENNTIQIFSNSKDYPALKSDSEKSESKRSWIVVEDPELEPGQMRFEATNAGVIFDEKKNLETVLGWTKSE